VVTLKGWGRAICKTVDVAEITVKKYAQDAAVKDIKINTERVTSRQSGKVNNVSSIEITLRREMSTIN
jgi:DNA-binding protein Alba